MAWVNLPELTGKAKYSRRPIVNKYREGKVKSSPEGRWNRPETMCLQGVEEDLILDCVPIEEWANELMYAAWLRPLGLEPQGNQVLIVRS